MQFINTLATATLYTGIAYVGLSFVLYTVRRATQRPMPTEPAAVAPAPANTLAELTEMADEVAALTARVAEVAAVVRPVPAMAASIETPAVTVTLSTEEVGGDITLADIAATEARAEAIAQPEQIDYQGLNSEQLRKLCQQRGIQWRNANGQGRHLKKGEMVAALAA